MKKKLRSIWGGKYSFIKRSLIMAIAFLLAFLSLHLMFNIAIRLPRNAQSPVDGILVLGGSISREIYAAKLAKQNPSTPILISRGSSDPCIVWVFQRAKSPMNNVWLEICSRSTFTNFMFGVPILEDWQVHKVQLITSGTHIRRAKWLAKIILGSHGIWVDLVAAPEKGVPGNNESLLKTGIDFARSIIWTFLSQTITPRCSDVYPLDSVDVTTWKNRNFACERQGNINVNQNFNK